jgi:hypothetical protein
MSDKAKSGGGHPQARNDARRARLARELRANLLKRKAQAKSKSPRGTAMRGDRVKPEE